MSLIGGDIGKFLERAVVALERLALAVEKVVERLEVGEDERN